MDNTRHFAPRRENGYSRNPWEGATPIKPWNHRVTACIPVMDFHEDVRLIIELLRLQTIRPYIVLVDTGSLPEHFLKMEELRADDVEVHRLALNGVLHPCDFPAMAMDVCFTTCRTPFLLTTHQDLFFRKRTVIEEMLPLAEKHHAVGYHISKERSHKDVSGMIGHQCSMFDIHAMDKLFASWSQRRLCNLFGFEDHRPGTCGQWFPDTELGINYHMRNAGLSPHIIGQEEIGQRFVDDRIDHCRAINTYSLYHPQYVDMAARWISAARHEAAQRISTWMAEDAAKPKPRLSVITAMVRRENLDAIGKSLEPLRKSFDVEWIVAADTSRHPDLAGTHGPSNHAGAPQKQWGLEQATGEWLWWLDDDNLCLPHFGEVLLHSIRQHPEGRLFVFDQIYADDGTLRCVAKPQNLRYGGIDQAQYVVHRSAVGDTRFVAGLHANDWLFVEEIAKRVSPVFVRNPCVTYNALAPDRFRV